MTNSHVPIIIQYVRTDPRTRPRCPRPTAVSASEGCVELCCVASPVMEINKIHEESDCRGRTAVPNSLRPPSSQAASRDPGRNELGTAVRPLQTPKHFVNL